MTKVHATRPNEPTVRLSRWSVAYNVAFVVNLATTPFMAYLTEPLPGRIAQVHLPEWNTFQEFTAVMTTYLHSLYNNTTMLPSEVVKQDKTTNTFAMRVAMEIPFSIPESQVQGYLADMAGSPYFAEGVEAYMTTFLTSNASSRALMKPWRICQHQSLVGINFGEYCFWLDESVDSMQDSNSPCYAVWAAIYPLETPQLSWFKFFFRSIVSGYVLFAFWTRYYRQFRPLLHNLRTVGFGSEYIHYQVVLGDPAYAILIDPFVSFAMFVDIWCAAPYLGMATIRVSQFQDLLSYGVGWMYFSRTVWFAYLCMRGLSSVIKWRRWEASFAPVDPGFLAICAYMYGGPMTSAIVFSPMVGLTRESFSYFLPSALHGQAIETAFITILCTLVMALFPVVYSLAATKWSRCKQRRLQKSRGEMATLSFSSPAYNDIKAILLMSMVMRKQHPTTGGSLHNLYHTDPRYRSMPLFSHRAADCFVVCYNVDGKVAKRVRLSLLAWLDRQSLDPKLEIQLCTALHSTSVCVFNDKPCVKQGWTSLDAKYIHVGDTNSPWIM